MAIITMRLEFFLLLTVLLWMLQGSHASNHGQHYSHRHRHHVAREHTVSAVGSGAASFPLASRASNAEKLVKRALGAASILNKARLDNPSFNKLEYKRQAARKGPPPKSPSLLERADALHLDALGKPSSPMTAAEPMHGDYEYSISPELAEAARITAESSPPTKLHDNPASTIASLRKKYGYRFNDTNTPQQVHIRPNGLEGRIFAAEDELQLVSTINTTSGSNRTKRGNPTYWMANLAQQGRSPFAPSRYKVWTTLAHFNHFTNLLRIGVEKCQRLWSKRFIRSYTQH